MSRNVRIVLLCEDRQHEAFVRRLRATRRLQLRDLKVRSSPGGRGSAEQWVRTNFPQELKAIRAKGAEAVYLIVMIDGDRQGVASRKDQLANACLERGVEPPGATDHVLVCVPTWNIETWLAYLGGDTVQETKPDYPRLARPGDCTPHVRKLAEMCTDRDLRVPSPRSLEGTCRQYRRHFG